MFGLVKTNQCKEEDRTKSGNTLAKSDADE
jgi:hypothetical protein